MKLVKNGPLYKNLSIFDEIMVPKRRLWKLKSKKKQPHNVHQTETRSNLRQTSVQYFVCTMRISLGILKIRGTK